MKRIDEKLFGVLYDDLYDHLEKRDGDLSGLGIKSEEVEKYLKKLWHMGKLWDMITIIICYHYTREDSVIIKFSGQAISISQGSSLTNILRCFGLTKINKIQIPIEEFEDEYKKLDEIFPKTYKGKKAKIGSLLTELGIAANLQGLLIQTWKEERRWETIVAVMALLRTTYYTIIVETDRGTYQFNKDMTLLQILETLI
jgi:hypothetical protein